ncbi:MAG: prephenate dehydrogenase/arogenate dehydrogenase family protein [Acidimicrobiales bacterium]
MTSPAKRSAHVVGLGLIGSSVALALGATGWRVTGEDLDPEITDAALAAKVIAGRDMSDEHVLLVIATPAGAVAGVARDYLERFRGSQLIATDVAGVKSSIVSGVSDARFLGGHPMAGSEQRGLKGARLDLFSGCTWVLTPTPATSPSTYTTLHGYLRDVGASVVAIDANDHDRLVALASHVPHLLAGALMNEATKTAEQDPVLLQLAAGGFRDMTRIAAGDPAIWPDVLFENREAIDQTLEALEGRLEALRRALATDGRATIEDSLHQASVARRQLPGRALSSENLAYLRIVVSDRPGVLATVTKAASDLQVNIYDIEIAHGIEGVGGTLLLAVDATLSESLADSLTALGFQVAREQ